MNSKPFYDFANSCSEEDFPQLTAEVVLAIGAPMENDYPVWISFPNLEKPIEASLWLEQGARSSHGERLVLLSCDKHYYRSLKIRPGSVEFNLCIRPQAAVNWIWRQRIPVLHPSLLDFQVRSFQIGNTTATEGAIAYGGNNHVTINPNRPQGLKLVKAIQKGREVIDGVETVSNTSNPLLGNGTEIGNTIATDEAIAYGGRSNVSIAGSNSVQAKIGNTTATDEAIAYGGRSNVTIHESRAETTCELSIEMNVVPRKHRIEPTWKVVCDRRNREVAELQLVHANQRWSIYGGDRLVFGRNASIPQREDQHDFIYRNGISGKGSDCIGRVHGELSIGNHEFKYRHVKPPGSEGSRVTACQINGHEISYTEKEDGKALGLDTRRTSYLQPGDRSWNRSHSHMAVRPWYGAQLSPEYSYYAQEKARDREFAAKDSLGGFYVELVNVNECVHGRHLLIKSMAIIGRNPELSQIAFPEADPKQIKERHARILWIDGGLWIEPYDHSCKVMLDGYRVHLHRLAPLTDKSTLCFGKNHIISCASIHHYV
jgi:hypothetical protein